MIVPAVTRLPAAGGAFEGERLSHAANPCADRMPDIETQKASAPRHARRGRRRCQKLALELDQRRGKV
jgi:hypothetical protein